MSIKIIFLESVPENEKEAVESFLNLWQNNDPFIRIYTSGSTGKPKRIKIPKAAMIESAKATGLFFKFKPNQRNVLALSANYVAGMMQIVRSIVFGLELVVVPVESNPLKHLSLSQLDFAAFVPLQLEAILKDEETRNVYENISNVIIGGAPINDDLNRSIEALTNHSFASFGMTETISHIALREIRNGNEIYNALPRVSFLINADDCLNIKAPHISKNDILTNDRVELITEKAFKWLGRFDFVINSGGVKIQPELVEKKIKNLIANSYYISSMPDRKLGSKVVLYIESVHFENDRFEKLMSDMRQVLDAYEVPKTVMFESKFNLTSTGKVIRK